MKYTVKAGDTLSQIGQKYGVDYRKISGYASGNPNLIRVGEVLDIPDAGGSTNNPPTFNDTNEIQNYLNKRQNSVYLSGGDFDLPKLDFNFGEAFKSAVADLKDLLPTRQAPTVPKLTEQYSQLRANYGIDALEQEVADLKATEAEIQAQYRINRDMETGRPVAQGVIQGRLSEQAKAANEDLDFIQRQKARKVDELRSAYGIIETMMNLTQKDFDNARAVYNDQFDKAYKIISVAQGFAEQEFDEFKQAQAVARANAQIFVNAIKEGNMDINSIPQDMKVRLNKLELQSGLPMGFFSQLKADPKANILSTTTRTDGTNKWADVVTVGSNGEISVRNVLLGKASQSSGTGYNKTSDKYLNQALNILKEQDTINTRGKITDEFGNVKKDTSDKLLSREEALSARERIISLVGDEKLGRSLFERAWNTGGYGIWEE